MSEELWWAKMKVDATVIAAVVVVVAILTAIVGLTIYFHNKSEKAKDQLIQEYYKCKRGE